MKTINELKEEKAKCLHNKIKKSYRERIEKSMDFNFGHALKWYKIDIELKAKEECLKKIESLKEYGIKEKKDNFLWWDMQMNNLISQIKGDEH